jgi:hypothetical protein
MDTEPGGESTQYVYPVDLEGNLGDVFHVDGQEDED